MSPPPVLKVERLSKSYGALKAVDSISFEVAPREIVGLVGPNGAGKTTTINMILGVLEAGGGTIEIEGVDLKKDRTRAMSHANFAAVYAPLPGNLTVEQNLRVFGMIYAVKNLSARINALLKEFELERFRKTKTGVLSSGEQTRVALAKAMLNEPHLLLLDEPTASIDPAMARTLRADIEAFPLRAAAACCGPATTCMRSRRSATACCSCRAAASCCRASRASWSRNIMSRAWKTCSSKSRTSR